MTVLQQSIQWIVRDLGDAVPGIESNTDVCGGSPCIVRTRIPVWVLEQGKRLGTSEADLLRCYPSLRAEDLTNAWAYVRTHRAEIEQQIRENEEDSIKNMAKLYGDENFPLPVVDELRRLEHDVITLQDTGKGEQGVSDEAVLALQKGGRC
ncbi:MAG: DUF5615 family PIN-like protein [Pseudomonadota bacterium]